MIKVKHKVFTLKKKKISDVNRTMNVLLSKFIDDQLASCKSSIPILLKMLSCDHVVKKYEYHDALWSMVYLIKLV